MASLNSGITPVIYSMARGAKSCVQTSMKAANSVTGILGIAMLIYSLWMIGVYFREMDDHKFYFPWFICAFAAAGISFCFIAYVGHTAANIASGICLSCYSLLLLLLLLLEASLAADLLLNHDWKKDFPKDPTKRFDDFVNYVEHNSIAFKWIALLVAFSQVTSFLMATILKNMGQDHRQSNFDGIDNHPYDKHPLLNDVVQPHQYAVGQAHLPSKKCAEC
ncbi:hypothetical protein Ancab_005212 [Ancistrocladus abbreviatus]